MLRYLKSGAFAWVVGAAVTLVAGALFLINSATANRLGIKTGDRIRLTSPAGSIEGAAQVVEGIHPQVFGVSNTITRQVVNNMRVRAKGSHFNRLLTGSMLYTDSATGGLESTARVRVERLGA